MAVSFNSPRQDEIGYNRRVNLVIPNQMCVKLVPKWGPEEGKMYSIIWSFLLFIQNVLFFLKGQGNMIFFYSLQGRSTSYTVNPYEVISIMFIDIAKIRTPGNMFFMSSVQCSVSLHPSPKMSGICSI